MTKIQKRLLADPRVQEAWSEESTDDGMWVALRPGFADTGFDPWQPCHTIHEWTWTAVMQRMRDVRPCACADCRPAVNPCAVFDTLASDHPARQTRIP